MEITIKIDGRNVSVEVSNKIAEFMDAGRRKAENLSHEKRRHWGGREFDEYIIASEGLFLYQSSPEDIVCGEKLWNCYCPFWTPVPQISGNDFCFMRCVASPMRKLEGCAAVLKVRCRVPLMRSEKISEFFQKQTVQRPVLTLTI